MPERLASSSQHYSANYLQNDVTQFPVKLPNVNVEPLSKDQYKVFADVSQTIYDGGNIRNQKNLAKSSPSSNHTN